MKPKSDCSVLIVNWNSAADTLRCIESVYTMTKTIRFEILVVDNASTERSIESVRGRFPNLRLIQNETNLGFAAGINRALPVLQGRHTVLLNPDTLLRNDALSKTVDFLDAHPDAGICGGRLHNEDDSPGVSYGSFPSIWHVLFRVLAPRWIVPKRWRSLYGRPFDPDLRSPLLVDWVSGADLCIRTELLKRLNGLDASYFFLFEDVDLCFRARQAGFRSFFLPECELVHFRPHGFKNSREEFRIHFYTSEFIFFKKYFKLSIFIYILDMVQWSFRWSRRLFRKPHKRAEWANLIKNVTRIQFGGKPGVERSF
jgi:GT2 family glycosyltransferase